MSYFDRFDIVQAHYWFLTDHHGGQWSGEYLRLCKMQDYYRPGMSENGPDTENAKAIYAQLCGQEGCGHEKSS